MKTVYKIGDRIRIKRTITNKFHQLSGRYDPVPRGTKASVVWIDELDGYTQVVFVPDGWDEENEECIWVSNDPEWDPEMPGIDVQIELDNSPNKE